MVTVIIPVYNEEHQIGACLASLEKQSYKDIEIILVDDGSVDNSKAVIEKSNHTLFTQNHQGPGKARNLGAAKAKGSILVFVDSDMTFDKDFIKNLIAPIINKKTKGTFTKNEYVSNWENPIARAWNYNLGRTNKERIPINYPNVSPVFRAIEKKEFDKVGGFDTDIGYTDDWSLSRKLKYKATLAYNAICYHKNPQSLKEVYAQARWIGKNEFITRSFIRKISNLLRFNPLIQIPAATILAIKKKEIWIIPIVCVYSMGIQMSIIKAFTGEKKYK